MGERSDEGRNDDELETYDQSLNQLERMQQSVVRLHTLTNGYGPVWELALKLLNTISEEAAVGGGPVTGVPRHRDDTYQPPL